MLATLLLLLGAMLGFAFAGSPERLAEGTYVAGVDVGGLTASDAKTLLERRAARFSSVPVVFTAGAQSWQVTPRQLGVEVDWVAAIEAARREGEGFGPVRGLRRLRTRVFGAEIAPPIRVWETGLAYQIGRIAEAVDRRARDASIVLRGLEPEVLPARTGRVLDKRSAEPAIARALASFSRSAVALPVRVAQPRVTAADLSQAAAQARMALSAPVRLALGPTRWRLPRWRIAELLSLPKGGSTELAVGGAGAERYFDRLTPRVGAPPRDARFEITADGGVTVVPGAAGHELDRESTATAMLTALLSRYSRLAQVVVAPAGPELTTEEAHALGITRVLASYSTAYAGTSDRINNLRLAVSLLDGALIGPGATFSFNARVGERTEERGFRSAPVIIGGEYEEGVGGGVSQVATTVFNAAWEAGIKITERAPHALYISRYPLGRDATVNYPDLDLKFVNDTDGWLVLRGFWTDSGITISLLGAPTGRRVESAAGSLRVIGSPPVRRIKDPKLLVGKTVVEEAGVPPQAVSVERTVYDERGDVLHDETWSTSYRGEKKIVRVGTKPKPAPKKKPKPKEQKEGEAAVPPPTEDVPFAPPPP